MQDLIHMQAKNGIWTNSAALCNIIVIKTGHSIGCHSKSACISVYHVWILRSIASPEWHSLGHTD